MGASTTIIVRIVSFAAKIVQGGCRARCSTFPSALLLVLPLLVRRVLHVAVVVNPVARSGHEQAHDGAEEVEEAVGEVGEGGYAEHGALRHAAGVPGHQHRGDGHGVLGAAAQQTALVAAAVVDALEHAAVEQNADVLVGYG